MVGTIFRLGMERTNKNKFGGYYLPELAKRVKNENMQRSGNGIISLFQ